MAAAVLATAVIVLLVPSAATTAAPSLGAGGDDVTATIRVPVDYRTIPPRGGWETIFVCGAYPLQHKDGGLNTAVAYIFGVNTGPPLRLRPFRVALESAPFKDLPVTVWKNSCVSSLRIIKTGTTTVREQSAVVTRTPLVAPRRGQPTVELRFDGLCTFPGGKRLPCAPRNPYLIKLTGTGASPKACRAVLGAGSGLRGFSEEDDGGNWGDDWNPVELKGNKRTWLNSGAATPALLERICGADTPRARRLTRELGQIGVRPAPRVAAHLRFKLSYTHVGLSHVCASIEADSGASLKVSIEGPNGYAASGTLQLKKKEQKTAPGSFSFRIFEFGSYKVTITSTADGKSVTKSQTISVTGAPGDSRCSATGAPPP